MQRTQIKINASNRTSRKFYHIFMLKYKNNSDFPW